MYNGWKIIRIRYGPELVFYVASYCQLVEVQEVSGGREGLVELSDLSHQDRVLQTCLQRHN